MKKRYRVKLYWEMCADVVVDAENAEEAMQKAIDGPLPHPREQEYVPDSANADEIDVVEIEPPVKHPILTKEKLDGIRQLQAIAFQTKPGSCPP